MELHIRIDRSSSRPLSRQLADHLRAAISEGAVPKGTRLPPSRSLATELGIGRRSVVDAFEQLVGEG